MAPSHYQCWNIAYFALRNKCQWNIKSQFMYFHARKYIWKCRLGNGGHFVSTSLLTWLRHQMETFSASLALCAGNPPVPSESPPQRPVTQSFDVFFDLRLNKRLTKQSRGWWFETPLPPLWRHCNQRTSSSVVPVMYHGLFQTTLLPEPMLTIFNGNLGNKR